MLRKPDPHARENNAGPGCSCRPTLHLRRTRTDTRQAHEAAQLPPVANPGSAPRTSRIGLTARGGSRFTEPEDALAFPESRLQFAGPDRTAPGDLPASAEPPLLAPSGAGTDSQPVAVFPRHPARVAWALAA